jgi:hypothetical protein
MEEKKMEKEEIFNSYIEYEKKFFPKLHKKKIDKKLEDKTPSFGVCLADDFLERIRNEIK